MSAKAIKIQDKIPKQKVCKVCKAKYTPNRPLQMLCSVKCSYKYVEILNKKKARKEKQEGYERLMTHSDWSNELQKIMNHIARLIDKDVPCISSLRMGGKIAGGHRFSVGANPQLRFNLLNIHAQSFEQNSHKSGNPDGYDKGLLELYGSEYLETVHELKTKYTTLKLTIPELIQAKSKASKVVSALKKLDSTYAPKMRIELRRKFNEQIGIYK